LLLFSLLTDNPAKSLSKECLMKMKTARLMLVCLILATGFSGPTQAQSDQPAILSHQAQVIFDISNHTMHVVDRITIPGGIDHLRLGDSLTIISAEGPGNVVPDSLGFLSGGEDEDGPYQLIDLKACGLSEQGGDLELEYSGTFFESVEEVTFSRENVGGEITATISEEGIYLSSMAGWLAWNENLMATHDLTFETPAGFETVTQGERTEHETRGDRLLTRWVATNPSDGLNLIANRYFVHEEPVDDQIVSQTFFLEDDAKLRATYMERTKAYIAMYEEMIGPYPYKKFATVENWFPTGYGMPSYTLLGGQVLRLPFIPFTSFGHEICHNWWGNSVFVDTSEGNWCEGLTVYCADYHYKELESAEQALQYRRTLLKDYAAYVNDPANDFPLSEFLSRHSGATRAIGYGKSMMVFHMIDRLIGREAFLEGMQAVAADNQYAKTTWTHFFAAFARASGEDLEAFQQQWLMRTGAPSLAVEKVEFGKKTVSFSLRQDSPPYDLRVPVVVSTKTGNEEHIVHLDKTRDRFELKVAAAEILAVDPETHLFRRLHAAEIEPTISQVLAEPGPTIVLDHATSLMVAAARKFADEFIEKPLYSFVEDGLLLADIETGAGTANVVINPGKELLAQYPNHELMISGKTFFLGGKRYGLDKYDLVFTAASPHDASITDLVIFCNSPHRLEALARRLGHYGKYSYLVFPVGQGSPVKGNWQLGDSPLVVKRK
jgi:Peptidase family M1 domain